MACICNNLSVSFEFHFSDCMMVGFFWFLKLLPCKSNQVFSLDKCVGIKLNVNLLTEDLFWP